MRRKEIRNKKLNARLYPIYKMVSWDLLFYYSIIYLFLVQAKGFTASQVLLSEAFFTALCLILQIPLGLLVDRFGKKNSLVFANICLCIYILILLFINSYTQLLIALFINAIGYVIKGICESNILYDSDFAYTDYKLNTCFSLYNRTIYLSYNLHISLHP